MQEEAWTADPTGASALWALSKSQDGRFMVGGLHGQVWLLERLDDEGKEWKRTMIGDFEAANVKTVCTGMVHDCLGRTFVFAGVQQTLRALKVWYLDQSSSGTRGCTPREITLSTPRDAKLRGFGSVIFLEEREPNRLQFAVACGLGIGKAHIWNLDISLSDMTCAMSFEGSVTTRRNSIFALFFLDSGKRLLSVTGMDFILQSWDLETIKADAHSKKQSTDGLEGQPFHASSGAGRVMQTSDVANELSYIELQMLTSLPQEYIPQWKSVMHVFKTYSPWSLMVPLYENDKGELSLEEDGYEGELDVDGKPHGYGTASLATEKVLTGCQEFSNGVLLYTGHWMHGKQDGFGELMDEDSGQVVYKGNWLEGCVHGRGKLVLRNGEFNGNFVHGVREGFGTWNVKERGELSSKRGKKRKVYPGEQYSGFWLAGFAHGLGKWTYPVTSPKLNEKSPDDIVHLGKTAAIVYHEEGQLLQHFFFHRLDGGLLSLEDKAVLTASASKEIRPFLSTAFAFVPDESGKYFGVDVCWKCCKTSASDDILVCPQCFLSTHAHCLGNRTCPMPTCSHDGQQAIELKLFSDVFSNAEPARFKDIIADKPSLGSSSNTTETSARKKRKVNSEPPITTKKESVEESEGAQFARKLARKLRRSRYDNHKEFFRSELKELRMEEIVRRKNWKLITSHYQAEVDVLRKYVEADERVLAQQQQELNRFQGQDLSSMSINDLHLFQSKVENLLHQCRVALESCATNTSNES